jgi:two-component system OmpR family sensor kinase
VARLMSVLAGLTDLLRAGELSPDRYSHSRVSLRDVARDVHETFDLLAGATGHELLLVDDGQTPPIRGDRALLTRAVANLVDNALKYSPPPGPVRLVVAARGSLVVVEVWDTGPGVAHADRQRIFEPFVRLKGCAGAASTGSGLGLAVVQSVVRAHGGSLSVQYEQGVGNVFRLSFLISAAGDDPPESHGQSALNSWSGPHGSIG